MRMRSPAETERDLDETLQANREHEQELMLLRSMISALFLHHPQKQQVLVRFEAEIRDMLATAPKGTDPEYLVELMARMQQHKLAYEQPPSKRAPS